MAASTTIHRATNPPRGPSQPLGDLPQNRRINFCRTARVILVYLAISLAALSGDSSAEIYRDDFNRADMDLRASPHWSVAHGAYYGYRTSANRLVSVYAPMVGPEAIGADKFVGATHRGEEYQRVSIDIRFPQTAGDGHAPQFCLVLNWQGTGLFANGYRLTLRGIRDFSVARIDEKGAEKNTSGWKTYPKDPLKTNQWYRLTLEKQERTIAGSIATLDSTVVGKTQIDDQEQKTLHLQLQENKAKKEILSTKGN